MWANLIVATYADRQIAAATAAAAGAELDGIVDSPVRVLARPDAPPETADLGTRDALVRLGMPDLEAQIYADLVAGGSALVAVLAREDRAELAHVLGFLAATPITEPLGTFRIATEAMPH